MKKLILYIILTVAIAATLSASVAAVTKDAEDMIYNCLLSATDEIDLTGYQLTRGEVSSIFDKLLNTKPDLFFVEPSYNFTYTEDDIVLSMLPKYKFTADALTTAKDEYHSFIENVADGVRFGWSDVQKILYVHDYLVLHTEYDTTLTYSDVYSLARYGTGTCVSYTLAFMAICDELGIDCSVAESPEMNHIWNVVMLDGEWYHVDVTWDDSVPNLDGRVQHLNFLCSDEAIRYASQEEHVNWTSDYECSSTKYDYAMWTNVFTPFVYTGGDWYAVDGEDFALYRYDFSDMSRTKLVPITPEWSVPGSDGYHYALAYSGIGVYDDFVYYNSPTAIYSYHIGTGDYGIVHIPDTDGDAIYHFTIEDGILLYNIASSPTSADRRTEALDLETGLSVYSVTYMAGGEVYAVQYYYPGDKITTPTAPDAGGFEGWDSLPATMPEENITVVAVYSSVDCTHEMTEIHTIVAPTCTSSGTAEVVCVYCDEVLMTSPVEPAHTPGEWHVLIEPTCSKEGLRRVSCSVCGETTAEEALMTTEHSFSDPVVGADGAATRTCTVCGHTESDTDGTETDDSTDTDESTDSAGTSPDTDVGGDITDGDDSDPVAIYVIIVIFSGIIISSLIYLIVLRRQKGSKSRK